MPSPSTLNAFAVASILLLLIPGPAVLYVVNRSVSDGHATGFFAVCGLTLGNCAHAIAAAVGLSAVLAASAVAFNTVKWLGAGDLIYVGVRALRTPPPPIDTDQAVMAPRKAFTQGVVVNVLNPKTGLFFLSFLPQFIRPGHNGGWQALVLGLEFVALGFCTDNLYALVASRLRNALLRGKSLPFIRRWVAGTIFIGLGLVAATASVSGSTK